MDTIENIEKKMNYLKERAFRKIKSNQCEVIPYKRESNSVIFNSMEKIDKMIFHFTKAENLKYIFENQTILLNRSIKMNDPIESKWYFSNIGTGAIINSLMNHNVRFACFCKPFLEIDNLKIPAYSLSRMWNQYGGNYDGCCIGFNKEKLTMLLKEQYPNSWRIEEIKYDIPLDPEYGFSHINYCFSTPNTLKIFESGDGYYKKWDDSMAKDLYMRTDMFGFAFSKSFDYRDENEIRFSIYHDSDEDKFIQNIGDAIDIIIFGYKISDEIAFEYDLQTKATVYKFYIDSPYRVVENTINCSWSKGYGKLKKITTPETKVLKGLRDFLDDSY